jgi:hypothetical protein
MRTRLLLFVVAALAFVLAPAGRAGTVVLAPVADISLPFVCSWGYDWEERCRHDDGPRLLIGGDVDKLWRAALRFSLAPIPPGSSIVDARLELWYDGACVGPGRTVVACPWRPFTLTANPIWSPNWLKERELDFDDPMSTLVLAAGARPGWLSWDFVDIVSEWWWGHRANEGVLLRVAEGETFLSSGPAPPSSSHSLPWRRPRLVVTYAAMG